MRVAGKGSISPSKREERVADPDANYTPREVRTVGTREGPEAKRGGALTYHLEGVGSTAFGYGSILFA